MTQDLITVNIKLFAIYQEIFNQETIEFKVLPQTTVRQILEELVKEKPILKNWIPLTRFGINQQFVEKDTLVKHGDEVVFIPPVSGG